MIDRIFITHEYDLFIMINHFHKNTRELLKIDLDEPNDFTDFEN